MTLSIQHYRESLNTVLRTVVTDPEVIIDGDFSSDNVKKGIAFNIAGINQERILSAEFSLESINFDILVIAKTRFDCDTIATVLINELQFYRDEDWQRFYLSNFSDVEFNPYEDLFYVNKIQVRGYLQR